MHSTLITRLQNIYDPARLSLLDKSHILSRRLNDIMQTMKTQKISRLSH